MWLWGVIIVSAICAVSSLYMTYLAFSVGDRGAFLFIFFGIFFGLLFVTSAIKVAARKSAFFKRADIKMSENPKNETKQNEIKTIPARTNRPSDQYGMGHFG